MYPAPPAKPKNGTATLYPPPERWKKPPQFFVTPGELKALALIAKGFAATSPTVGEGGAMKARLVQRIVDIEPERVYVVFDNDKAGRDWRDKMIETLEKAGLHASGFAFTDKATRAPKQATFDGWAATAKKASARPWHDRWNEPAQLVMRFITDHLDQLPRKQFELWPGIKITNLREFYADQFDIFRITEEPPTIDEQDRMARWARIREIIKHGLL